MERSSVIARLKRIEKGLERIIKDLERGKYERYGFKNPEEARPYIEYYKSMLERVRERLAGKR